MGDWFQTIVDEDAFQSEAKQLANQILDWLVKEQIVDSEPAKCVLDGDEYGYRPGSNYHMITETPLDYIDELRVNGLAVIVGRTVFHTAQSGFKLTCPECDTQNTENEEWARAVSEWYEQSGKGLLECLHCARRSPITTWIFDPAWGFGYLGFRFWNWPPLKRSFIDELSKRLGHRTVFIADKL